jgi:hypothetical protein
VVEVYDVSGFFKSQWLDVRGNAKWDIAKWTGAAVIGSAAYLLHKIGRVPDWTLGAGIFVLSLAVFWWATRRNRIANEQPQSQQPPDKAVAVKDLSAKSIDDFYRSYDNVMLREFEDALKNQMEGYPANDRQKYLLRVSATIATIALFENIWLSIFGSQIRVLEGLNKGPIKIDDLRPYYDAATRQQPTFYTNYSFMSWYAFMKGQVLVLEQGDMAALTVRGREFLKFMVSKGHSAEDRKG